MPLIVTIPDQDFWDEYKCEFVFVKGKTLKLEHSLVSISKFLTFLKCIYIYTLIFFNKQTVKTYHVYAPPFVLKKCAFYSIII